MAATPDDHPATSLRRPARPVRYAVCPGCFKQRKYGKNAKMLPHRMYDKETGTMVPCDGSGQTALNATSRKENSNGNT